MLTETEDGGLILDEEDWLAGDWQAQEEAKTDGRMDMVERRGSKWVVLSMEGKVLGEYDTEKEAHERLRQIEAAKHAKGMY